MKQKILLYGGAAVLLLVILIAAVAGTSKPKQEQDGIAGVQEQAAPAAPDETPEQQPEESIPKEPEAVEDDEKTIEETSQTGTVHNNVSPSIENGETTASSTQTIPFDEKQPNLSAVENRQPEPSSKQEPANLIADGIYQVGTDITAGEYLVFASEMAILENRKDLSDDFDSVIFNIALDNYSHAYITLHNGEYFKLTGGEMYPASSAPSIQPSDGVYKAGQYKIGTDLPAGSYKVTVDDANDIGFYEINQNSRQDMHDILEEDVVESAVMITVSNGQYVTLRNAKIEVN